MSEHVEFVKSRNTPDVSVPFRKLVRLFKVWRNGAFEGKQLAKVGSFFLELVIGKAYDEQKEHMTGEALPDMSRLAAWVIQHRLGREISFPDCRVPQTTVRHTGPVVVLDPINRDDNVAADWTAADRDLFLDRIDELRDVLRDAEIEAEYDLDAAIAFVDQLLPNFRKFSEE